jgi:hypothetical protein
MDVEIIARERIVHVRLDMPACASANRDDLVEHRFDDGADENSPEFARKFAQTTPDVS